MMPTLLFKNRKTQAPSWAAIALCIGCMWATTAHAQFTWPNSQILPSFASTDPVQDLIYLREIGMEWQAENEDEGLFHGTGKPQGDGWAVAPGIDQPNQHMIYGPYDETIPLGPNRGQFHLQIDNNTADNEPQVLVDVFDSTSGEILASQVINRRDFDKANQYQWFELPFNMTGAHHAIELRVFWFGKAHIKVDKVALDHGASVDEMTMFASLKGIVNYTKPRIFSFEGGSDDAGEGRTTWLTSLGLQWREVNDNWSLLDKYRSSIQGLIVTDPFQPDTTNLATSIARSKKALIVSPLLAERLTAAPYNLPILVDYRGRFNSKIQVYEELYNNVWPTLTHRAAVSVSPTAQRASLREYAVALGAATFWLDPNNDDEDVLLRKFLAGMGAGNVILGWWPQEYAGVLVAAEYGVATVASDWSSNLTVHSGMPRNIYIPPLPKKPTLQNKLYVSFMLSDGDNLQYTEHLMRSLWEDPNRGKVPMGWTVAPGMVDAMPGALNFYHTTSTVNDALISGPSGLGYTYPDAWPSISALNNFIAKTEAYNKKAGLNVITVWNINSDFISDTLGNAFAQYAPSLLGITSQNSDYGFHIYGNKLPALGLAGGYCSDEKCMKDSIADASAGWDGKSPRFIMIQGNPWAGMSPSSFFSVAQTLNSNYVVVRPDTAFQLIREANGLLWSSSSSRSSNIAPSSIASSKSSTATSSVSSSKSSTRSATSSSSTSTANGKQCNWYGTRYPLCATISSGWGYENGQSCISTSTCLTQPAPYGIVDSSIISSTASSRSSTPVTSGLSSGTYRICSKPTSGSNKPQCLDVEDGNINTGNGSVIQQYDYEGVAWQQWRVTPLGNNKYSIVGAYSNRSLDLYDGRTDDGTRPQLYDTVPNHPNQTWIIEYNSARGAYTIKSSVLNAAGRYIALDVPDGNTTKGTNLQFWTFYNNNPNQEWTFTKLY